MWNSEKGFGVVQADSAVLERYFLHISQVESAPAYPKAGMHVIFNVSTRPPRKEGGFTEACDAVIVAEPANIQTVAGTDVLKGDK